MVLLMPVHGVGGGALAGFILVYNVESAGPGSDLSNVTTIPTSGCVKFSGLG